MYKNKQSHTQATALLVIY